ncbi:putative transcriptional regulatory protein TTE1135 [Cochliomyia hominivorax]
MSIYVNCGIYLFKNISVNARHIFIQRNFSTARYALLAGHSKWANIRHIKAAKDNQKAALFTKLSRQIRLAIQEGESADPSFNIQLKSVLEEALRKNMPMATIRNNIQKCVQDKNKLKRYKLDICYGKKVFAVCVMYTDNYAGVKMDMATVLRKAGANILDASHLFEEVGIIQAVFDKCRLKKGGDINDMVMEDAIMYGAEDVKIVDEDSGVVNFICRPINILTLRKTIEANGYVIDNSEHIYIPLKVVELLPEEFADYQKFISKLREIPGIEEIYDNIDTK